MSQDEWGGARKSRRPIGWVLGDLAFFPRENRGGPWVEESAVVEFSRLEGLPGVRTHLSKRSEKSGGGESTMQAQFNASFPNGRPIAGVGESWQGEPANDQKNEKASFSGRLIIELKGGPVVG